MMSSLGNISVSSDRKVHQETRGSLFLEIDPKHIKKSLKISKSQIGNWIYHLHPAIGLKISDFVKHIKSEGIYEQAQIGHLLALEATLSELYKSKSIVALGVNVRADGFNNFALISGPPGDRAISFQPFAQSASWGESAYFLLVKRSRTAF